MEAERWERINELFHAALQRESVERAAFLSKACVGDDSLLEEVQSLIRSHEKSDDFIETPAADIAADLLADTEPKLTPGHSVGPYRIVSLLGEGGMGQVYLADDTRLNRKIALKLLPPQFTIHRDRVRRFEREARAASALNHPNIVTIYEIGQSNSAHFIATEFVDGKTLRQLINEKPFREALNVVSQVATALTGAHAAGIVHRDIKPENIMIRTDGYVKILDFGLAKLTELPTTDSELETPTLLQSNPGLVMGTVQYMSPEQARGKNVGVRTDIWSLGVVLYELLAGRVPFSGETPSHVMVSLMEDELLPLTSYANVPAELDRIVTKALRKNQKERYQTASHLALDLKNLKGELQLEARLKGFLEAVPSSKEKRTVEQAAGRALKLAAPTVGIGVAHPTSSAEYLVNEIKSHRRALALGTTVLVIAALAAYFYVFRSGHIASSNDAIDSVAVLPFVNVNNDPNTEYLSDGITDSIINSLDRLPSLRVMSLNAVLRFKGKPSNAQVVGKALNVRAVLMGRLTQQGDTLIISTELVDVRDNRRLWGEQYNRKLSEILVVQTEIAQEISRILRLRLSTQDQKQLAKRYTENAEAYRLYNLGKFSGGGYSANTRGKEELEKAVSYYQQAIKLDQNYALAYVGLAGAYHQLGFRGFWLPKDAWQKAEWAALKAVELDDTLAEAHVALAAEKFHRDPAAAEKELKRALELDPNSVEANGTYALALVITGRRDEAIDYAQRTEELNKQLTGGPERPAAVAFVYFLARQYDKAIEGYKKALEKYPNNAHFHFFLGEVYLVKGMYQEGVVELEKAVTLDNAPERWDRYPVLAFAHAVSGKRNEAQKILNEQTRLAKQRYISPYNFAIIYTGLGDKDRAFEYLNRAYDEDVYVMNQFPARPMFDSLRSDRRYNELLKRMNRVR